MGARHEGLVASASPNRGILHATWYAAWCMPPGMVYVRGTKVSSVPFDAVNAEHAAVLRNADEAEARHVAN